VPAARSQSALKVAPTQGTYLFPGYDGPSYLAGVPYTPPPDLADNATTAAGNKMAYLLHPLGYSVVVRQDITVLRLPEMFAEQGKVEFYIFQRTGGQPVLTEAVARLVTA
jgi:HK97 family phage major capsid protein